MVLATWWGWSDLPSIALAIALAFLFGYALTIRPVLRSGLPLRAAVKVALAADTLSILTMEIVDNAILLAIPGAMDAGLTSPLFWGSLAVALADRLRGHRAGQPGPDRPRQGPRGGARPPPLSLALPRHVPGRPARLPCVHRSGSESRSAQATRRPP